MVWECIRTTRGPWDAWESRSYLCESVPGTKWWIHQNKYSISILSGAYTIHHRTNVHSHVGPVVINMVSNSGKHDAEIMLLLHCPCLWNEVLLSTETVRWATNLRYSRFVCILDEMRNVVAVLTYDLHPQGHPIALRPLRSPPRTLHEPLWTERNTVLLAWIDVLGTAERYLQIDSPEFNFCLTLEVLLV